MNMHLGEWFVLPWLFDLCATGGSASLAAIDHLGPVSTFGLCDTSPAASCEGATITGGQVSSLWRWHRHSRSDSCFTQPLLSLSAPQSSGQTNADGLEAGRHIRCMQQTRRQFL